MSEKMKVKLTKKQIEANRRAAARIARRERAFKKMSTAEQRVTIAKDVIEALKLKKITARQGQWLNLKTRKREVLKMKSDTQLRDVIVAQKTSCTACALGAVFTCAVMRQDAITIDGMRNEYTGALFFGDEDITRYLSPFFSQEQLEMIETAFEKGRGRFGYDDASQNFGCKYKTPEERMIAIMKNIIAHKGDFTPPPVRYDDDGMGA